MSAQRRKVIKYTLHYRESPESPQWEEDFYTKGAADAKALSIFLGGGIAVVVEGEEDEPSNGKDNEDEQS